MSECERAKHGVPGPSQFPRTAHSVPFDDLSILLPDWRRHLRASNKAPLTIDSYLAAGNQHLAPFEPRAAQPVLRGLLVT